MSIKEPDEFASEIRMARLSGKSLLDIAVEYDTSTSTVFRICAGIPRPASVRMGRPRSVDYGRIAELRARGMTHAVISERIGVGRSTVTKALGAYTLEAAE